MVGMNASRLPVSTRMSHLAMKVLPLPLTNIGTGTGAAILWLYCGFTTEALLYWRMQRTRGTWLVLIGSALLLLLLYRV